QSSAACRRQFREANRILKTFRQAAEKNRLAACAPLRKTTKMSILQTGIAREFGVRQLRAAEIEVVGANVHRREKIVRAAGADDVVLIDAVAADADGAD